MKKNLILSSVALLMVVGIASAFPNNSVNINIVDSSPNSAGVITGGTGTTDPFSIPMQFAGTGDWKSNDWGDGNNYVLKMDLAGGLPVVQSFLTCPVTAQWTFTGYNETTILFGTVTDFVYGGPTGTSTAHLITATTVYGTNWVGGDPTTGTKLPMYAETYYPGAYQGFGAPSWGHEDNARLMYWVYDLSVDNATGVGTLTAVPEPATMSLLVLGVLGFVRRQTR